MFQSIKDFRRRNVLTIKYIVTLKETLKLMFKIRKVVSFKKTQLLQKHYPIPGVGLTNPYSRRGIGD